MTKPQQLEGIGMILEDPDGPLWTNQAGGFACLHPEIRGSCMDIRSEGPELVVNYLECVLHSYFTGPKWRGWCLPYDERFPKAGFDEETARFVDALLEDCHWFGIQGSCMVDRERMKQSMEAWVYIRHSSGKRGVLYWENSD